MRSRISAQSCASVPPASAWIVTTASPRVVLAGEERVLLQALELARSGTIDARRRRRAPRRASSQLPRVGTRTFATSRRSARAAAATRCVLGADAAPRAAGRPRSRAARAPARARRAGPQRSGVKGNHGPSRAGPRSPSSCSCSEDVRCSSAITRRDGTRPGAGLRRQRLPGTASRARHRLASRRRTAPWHP